MPKKTAQVIQFDAAKKLKDYVKKIRAIWERRQSDKITLGKLLFEARSILIEDGKWLEYLEKDVAAKGLSITTAYRYMDHYKQSNEFSHENSPPRRAGGRPKGSSSTGTASRRGSGGAQGRTEGTGGMGAGPGNSAVAAPPSSPSHSPLEGGTGGAGDPLITPPAPPTLDEIATFLDRIPGSAVVSQLSPYLAREFGLRLSIDVSAVPPRAPDGNLEAELKFARAELAKNERGAAEYVHRKETEIRGLHARIAVLEEENKKFKGEGAYARNTENTISTKDAERFEQRIETLGRRLQEKDDEVIRLQRIIDAGPSQAANQMLVIDQLRKDKTDLKATLERVRTMSPEMYATKFVTYEPAQRHEIMRMMADLDAAEPGACDSEKADWILAIYARIYGHQYRNDAHAKLRQYDQRVEREADRGSSRRLREKEINRIVDGPPDYRRQAAPGELLKPDKSLKRSNGRERPPSVPDGDY